MPKYPLLKTYLAHVDEQREIEREKREAETKALLEAIASSGHLQVKTLDLEYEAGAYYLWNGVKGGGNRGYGWSEMLISSKLLLFVEGPQGKVSVRVDRAFKTAVGRLTEKRRALIRQTMPERVTLVSGVNSWSGKPQIEVSPDELDRWVAVVAARVSESRPKTRTGGAKVATSDPEEVERPQGGGPGHPPEPQLGAERRDDLRGRR